MNADHQHTKLTILGQNTVDYTSLLLKKAPKKTRVSEEDVGSNREAFRQSTRKSIRKQIATIPRSTVHDVLHKKTPRAYTIVLIAALKPNDALTAVAHNMLQYTWAENIIHSVQRACRHLHKPTYHVIILQVYT